MTFMKENKDIQSLCRMCSPQNWKERKYKICLKKCRKGPPQSQSNKEAVAMQVKCWRFNPNRKEETIVRTLKQVLFTILKTPVSITLLIIILYVYIPLILLGDVNACAEIIIYNQEKKGVQESIWGASSSCSKKNRLPRGNKI